MTETATSLKQETVSGKRLLAAIGSAIGLAAQARIYVRDLLGLREIAHPLDVEYGSHALSA
jgi:hypothetical protein